MALRDVAAAVTRDPDKPVRQQLERLLASATFKQVDRLKRFLSFIVLESIGGRSTELKEYVIGVQVFGKEPSFDPRTDPIVRVQARRLRAKLVRYYQEEGASDEVIIELPKGGYAPVFKRRETSVGRQAIDRVGAGQPEHGQRPALRGTMAADRSSTTSAWASGKRSSTAWPDSRTCGFSRSRTPAATSRRRHDRQRQRPRVRRRACGSRRSCRHGAAAVTCGPNRSTRTPTDLFAAQERVAQAIAQRLEPEFADGPRPSGAAADARILPRTICICRGAII